MSKTASQRSEDDDPQDTYESLVSVAEDESMDEDVRTIARALRDSMEEEIDVSR